MLVLVKKFAGEKRECVTVCCHDVTSSSFIVKVQGKIFEHFHTAP
jgi:hypothetical protein